MDSARNDELGSSLKGGGSGLGWSSGEFQILGQRFGSTLDLKEIGSGPEGGVLVEIGRVVVAGAHVS